MSDWACMVSCGMDGGSMPVELGWLDLRGGRSNARQDELVFTNDLAVNPSARTIVPLSHLQFAFHSPFDRDC
eukprot:8300212-Pyramimonas_sp.AAC.1